MAAQRGITDPDPGRIGRARERKRLSREGLADAIGQRLGQTIVTKQTIAKIETGRRVEPARYRPVLIELGLAPEPSREEPRPKQAPGEWVRELREAHGIPPTIFCLHAQYPNSEERLSRSTLNAIEERGRVPSFLMVDAIATGFKRSGVDIDTLDLEDAWVLFGGKAVVDAWESQIMREPSLVRWLERQPERIAGLAEALSNLTTHLNDPRPLAQGAPDNLIRMHEALTRMQRRASEGEAAIDPVGLVRDLNGPAADPPRSAN